MAKNIAVLFGVIFIIVGLAGFFVEDELLGFGVNMWHNIIHLATGLLALGFGMKGEASAQGFLKLFGIIYLLVALFGLLGWDAFNSWLNVNTHDTILHIVVAIIFLVGGFMGSKK